LDMGATARRAEAAISRYLNDPKKGISVPLRCYLRSAFPMLVHEERAGPCLVPTQNPALSNHRYSDRPIFRSVKPHASRERERERERAGERASEGEREREREREEGERVRERG
jgi:hypothetical protein